MSRFDARKKYTTSGGDERRNVVQNENAPPDPKKKQKISVAKLNAWVEHQQFMNEEPSEDGVQASSKQRFPGPLDLYNDVEHEWRNAAPGSDMATERELYLKEMEDDGAKIEREESREILFRLFGPKKSSSIPSTIVQQPSQSIPQTHSIQQQEHDNLLNNASKKEDSYFSYLNALLENDKIYKARLFNFWKENEGECFDESDCIVKNGKQTNSEDEDSEENDNGKSVTQTVNGHNQAEWLKQQYNLIRMECEADNVFNEIRTQSRGFTFYATTKSMDEWEQIVEGMGLKMKLKVENVWAVGRSASYIILIGFAFVQNKHDVNTPLLQWKGMKVINGPIIF